ncbi:hypothetical protein ME1_01151 [Bartonella vinsonii subsp. arupensis OK-94-513]|uniref:Uncharacterized protein n=2 Tax=Bartonella vinsonii subsp. arupensis TaxID=110578 RepID=J0QWK5_BARVI|nr:hypothetical protein ME1_01151 [Bartonella vinsonii subsp. arupensis OK-94-513]EJF98991.1 hypothetical protein MEI_00158 [Bartonella vinsonii subsp. arupensis Pm136co]
MLIYKYFSQYTKQYFSRNLISSAYFFLQPCIIKMRMTINLCKMAIMIYVEGFMREFHGISCVSCVSKELFVQFKLSIFMLRGIYLYYVVLCVMREFIHRKHKKSLPQFFEAGWNLKMFWNYLVF